MMLRTPAGIGYEPVIEELARISVRVWRNHHFPERIEQTVRTLSFHNCVKSVVFVVSAAGTFVMLFSNAIDVVSDFICFYVNATDFQTLLTLS